MKKELFEVYMPVHLRRLRQEIAAKKEQQKRAKKGIFDTLTKIVKR